MEEKGQKQVKGIRISTVNIIMIFISCVLYILLIIIFFLAASQCKHCQNNGTQ